jgi:DNA-binding transcriptional ArsR family regulator
VITALADPTRRQVFDMLTASGAATATTLADQIPVSRQAVVKHLAALDMAGLIQRARVGREVRYEIRKETLDMTARWMALFAAEWDRRLCHTKRLAEGKTGDRKPSP